MGCDYYHVIEIVVRTADDEFVIEYDREPCDFPDSECDSDGDEISKPDFLLATQKCLYREGTWQIASVHKRKEYKELVEDELAARNKYFSDVIVLSKVSYNVLR